MTPEKCRPLRPTIPLPMAGGRAQPGNTIRQVAWPGPVYDPLAPATNGALPAVGRPRTRPGAPAASPDGPRGLGLPTTERRRLPAQQTLHLPGPGQLLVGRDDRIDNRSPPQMDDWLDGRVTSWIDHEGEAAVAAVVAAGHAGVAIVPTGSTSGGEVAGVDAAPNINDNDGCAGFSITRTAASAPISPAEAANALAAALTATSLLPVGLPPTDQYGDTVALLPLSTSRGTGAAAAASSSRTDPPKSAKVATRIVRICLVGDVGAGKTALYNRLVNGTFPETSPSLAPESKSVLVRLSDGRIVNVELWDFHGPVADQRGTALLSTFFDASIICHDMADVRNLKSLANVWKPKLDASLQDRALFVLGLKGDLRPADAEPMLGLSLLPTKPPMTAGMTAAAAIEANGYAECSAKTGENVLPVWKAIVEYVVADVERHERRERRRKCCQHLGAAVVEMVARCCGRRKKEEGRE